MTVTDALAALVRGDTLAPATWHALEAQVDAGAFCAAAEHHGVTSIVADRMRTMSYDLSEALASRMQDLSRLHAAADLAREVELRAALVALDAAGVRPLLFKGAQLAYTDYARPDLRPRVDTDVLIPADAVARDAAHDALTRLGYETPPHVGGDLVMTQRAYVKRRGPHALHAIDVHWRIANPQAFTRVLEYEELASDAIRLPRLSPVARGLSGTHAILVACIHRVAHHANADSLIWLYDIDRIARRLDPEEWAAFGALAIDRQMAHVCRVSLERAADRFGTPVPVQVSAALAQHADGTHELSREFLTRQSGVAAALRDWRALGSWRDRARLAAEHLLPPAEYMRGVYARGSRAPLAWLYARRVVAGARKWLTSSQK